MADFLEACECVAALAAQEARLRKRRRNAEAGVEKANLVEIDRELEEVGIEKRISLCRALDAGAALDEAPYWAEPGA